MCGVSVIMPAYNAEKTIEESILSVLNQTYTDLELIVLDDGSSDATVGLVEQLALTDRRIRLVINENNLGVAKTRNRGFNLAQGKYTALLDSDDMWHADKLNQQVSLMEKKNADLVYCGYEMIDEKGNKVCDDFVVPESTSFDELLVRSVISCSTALIRTDLVKDNQFQSGYYHEDYVFWLTLLQKGAVAVGIPDVLASYRLLEGSRASNKINAALHRWKVYRDYLNYSVLKSIWITFQYAVLGILKYRRR